MSKLNLYCHYCNTIIYENSITICECPIYFHKKCLKLYEKKNDLLIVKNCNRCNKEYNIEFINNFYKNLYYTNKFLNNIFIYYLYFIYIIGLITLLFKKNILIILLLFYSIIINSIILFTEYQLKKQIRKKIILPIILNIFLFILYLILDDRWLYYSLILIFNAILFKLKRYLFIYSTSYFYIECKKYSRINSII